MKHVSSSTLVRVAAGILLLDIKPRESLPIMGNFHKLTLLTLPAFIQVTSIVTARIILLWSIIAPPGSADNLASTRTSISPSSQAHGLSFDFISHVCAMEQTLRCSSLVNAFLWRESSLKTSKSGGPMCSPIHHVLILEVTQRGRDVVQLTKIFEAKKVLMVGGTS